MRFRRGGRLKFSPGRPEFHVLEPHVTHDQDSPRHTRRMRVAPSQAFDCTKVQHMQGRWRMQHAHAVHQSYLYLSQSHGVTHGQSLMLD
jgi:hypothetical protein